MKALLSSPRIDRTHRAKCKVGWRPVVVGSGPMASNHLLSVLATPDQTPHSIFAVAANSTGLEKGAPSYLRSVS